MIDHGLAHMAPQRGDDDRTAVEQLFRQEYGRLVVVLSAQLRDRGGAEECAQDAFVEVVRHWGKLGAYEDPKAWLWLVALRKGAKWRKRRGRALTAVWPTAPTAELDALIDLHDAIRALPERQREVTTLHYLADLSIAAIATQLGISEGTVKSQLHDARLALRGNQHDQSD